MRLVIVATLLAVASAERYRNTWSFQQPDGTSPAGSWVFVPAGSFPVPVGWTNAMVSWTFDGVIDTWYDGQASAGLGACYAPSTPGSSARISSSCAIASSVQPYALGVWLFGTASVAGGLWTVTVDYSVADPAPGPPPPPPIVNSPQEFTGAWVPSTGSSCAAGAGGALLCEAGASSSASTTPPDQTAHMTLPSASTPFHLGVFVVQAQHFSANGFPAPLVATDSTRTALLWQADMPNTPSGESCQYGGGDCPSGSLNMPSRPSAFAAELTPDAVSLIAGYAPISINSWGSAGGQLCASAGAPQSCASYGPSVTLTVGQTHVITVPTGAHSGMAPSAWKSSW